MQELQIIKEIAKANIAEIYQDSSQPAVRVVGKSMAQCVSLFATPVGRMAEIFEKNIHKYIDRLEGLKEVDIVSPDTRILVPILERLRYTDDDLVANYYAEILATASKKEHASKVIVTFIEILNRLSADEIKILEYMNSEINSVNIQKVTEEESKNYDIPLGATSLSLKGSFPIIDINLHSNKSAGYSILRKNFNLLKSNINFDNLLNIDLYIDNMTSLGLLERGINVSYAVSKIYDHLEQCPEVEAIKINLKEGERVEFIKSRIDLTNLGIKLLNLCAKKDL